MKLSDAIRLGAMLKPQGFFVPVWCGRTCALGAAADALGKLRPWHLLTLSMRGPLVSEWPWLEERITSPVTGKRVIVARAIWQLNDVWGWTREEIATWVATIEQQQEAPEPQPVHVEVK